MSVNTDAPRIEQATAAVLRPGFTLGETRLTVRDLDTVADFWTTHVGLHELGREDGVVRLGSGSNTLLELIADPDAPAPARTASGLFHLAILVPTRQDLAAVIHRFGARGTPLQGASDHLVSEALYLADPEGNGIEIYRDRPRDEWPFTADGGIAMDTLPLDIGGVVASLEGDDATIRERQEAGIPEGTTVGHVHLKVFDAGESSEWYRTVLGMPIMARYGDQAAFAGADGYHHHIGMNTWHSRGGAAPAPGSAGLAHAVARLADDAERSALMDRAANASAPIEQDPATGDPIVTDPAGNRWLLAVRSA